MASNIWNHCSGGVQWYKSINFWHPETINNKELTDDNNKTTASFPKLTKTYHAGTTIITCAKKGASFI